MATRTTEDSTPLVEYIEKNLWSNPEENQQYQVKMVRISGEFGVNGNFGYMRQWRSLPHPKRYFHVFSVGGLVPGYWNFMNHTNRRNPFDRWLNLGQLAKARGIQLDIYGERGFQYSRSNAWVMSTQDGLTLIALEKLRSFPFQPNETMYFRTYGPSQQISVGEQAMDETGNPFIYETMVFEKASEIPVITARYLKFKAMPGFTGTFLNGVLMPGAPNEITGLKIGDIVEIWHDPTVIRQEIYQYSSLKDFYSELDKKRKVILHPPKRPGDFTLRYFDDNDYYLLSPGGKALYLNRNSVGTIRQLTHVDVSIADDVIQQASTYVRELNDLTKLRVMVLIRETDWKITWPHEHQRLRYLYRMSDEDIVKAFTGERANMAEWTADGLERGPVIDLLRRQYGKIKKDDALLSVGYNAATRVLSETPIRATYQVGGRGIEVPLTYRDMFTAWEHDENGHLIGYWNVSNQRYYSPVSPACKLVEFTLGHSGRELDYTVTNQDTDVDKTYDIRVYVSAYSINTGGLVGELTDVTGNASIYKIVNGRLIWVGLNKVNQRGIILYNRGTLAYEFQLDHIDHSLAFALTHIYAPGGLIFPIPFAQVDIWLNGKCLVDKVDWLYKDKYCYIISKEFIVEGAQTIMVRAFGFKAGPDNPNDETELGFVDGGVIGRFDRYNLRADRVTRTVIYGSLIPTDEVPRAEREVPDDQWDPLNGRPYMVKHVHCPIRFVENYDNYPGKQRSREVDSRVSDYLTRWLPKPQSNAEEIHWEVNQPVRPVGSGVPVLPNLQDKYLLFSPFMNVVVNGVKNGLITIPELVGGETAFNNQDIREALKSYEWWLAFDPIPLKFDRRYFAILPYANYEKLTVKAIQLMFIKQVNDLYLDSVCAIEGHFEVNNNV